MQCCFQQVVQSKFKIHSYASLKYTHWYKRVADDIVKNVKFTKEYWNRVNSHKNRKFVLNWYYVTV
jgi:hypothetical protein